MPAKFQVSLTHLAAKDIEEIWSYIAADSPAEAVRFVRSLEDQLATLGRFPSRCAWIRENVLLGTEYRHLIYKNYRSIFRIRGKRVYVLRVIHTARLLDSSHLT
jgi:plasmid stabilization system protein ParE